MIEEKRSLPRSLVEVVKHLRPGFKAELEEVASFAVSSLCDRSFNLWGLKVEALGNDRSLPSSQFKKISRRFEQIAWGFKQKARSFEFHARPFKLRASTFRLRGRIFSAFLLQWPGSEAHRPRKELEAPRKLLDTPRKLLEVPRKLLDTPRKLLEVRFRFKHPRKPLSNAISTALSAKISIQNLLSGEPPKVRPICV